MTKKKRIDPVEVIQIDAVTNGPAKGWVHTHGLGEFGKPELEIRNVPPMFFGAAAMILNEIADYMLNDAPKPVLAGQTMQLGRSRLKFVKAEADEKAGYDLNHYETDVLKIESLDETSCQHCHSESETLQ